ncbi:putative pilus assembly protein FilE [Acinetobacter sp. WZC-1]|uniref:putative pilus assembly protein FilE n=1 Tax=Acinetobacter sp. WZC-1 TaxID=3459034 RepID=UPI00403D6101
MTYRQAVMSLCLGVTPMVWGGGFYTIIGPDGRPIVVQQRVEVQQKTVEPTKLQREIARQPLPVEQKEEKPAVKSVPLQHEAEPSGAVLSPATVVEQNTVTEKNTVIKSPVIEVEKAVTVKTDHSAAQSMDALKSQQPLHEHNTPSTAMVPPAIASSSQMNQQAVAPAVPIQSAESQHAHASRPSAVVKKNDDQAGPALAADKNFTVIDGVKYVNNEYLEEKEFNLEGKKRFYVMPEMPGVGSAGRLESVEREKGVGRSTIDWIRGRKSEQHAPMALSSSYYRLPRAEVVQTLGQSCFSGKKIDKAKSLSLKNQQIGFWPVPPIKENFAFEIVKLDPGVQDILLTSYASSSREPSYYWPLVVFLDQQGCVIEGVSGFKNQEINANHLQHAALEGLLKKPASAAYLFMTPLSAAIDAENKQLTNQGQIKLSVIR